MKKSLITTSVAILLASTSAATFASSVTIPNTFVAGQPAVAADVNANFDAVAVGVNDNDSRVTTNTGNITTNTGNITTNTGNITTNTDNITTNTGNITTNTADIATNTADISALQGGASCPGDMTAVGSICVDKYEASIWDAATLGTQLQPTASINPDDTLSFYRCIRDGDDCGASTANAATAIYARSVTGVLPAFNITWYQAAQACANVGKRLPTTAEWQMAASGTLGANCNFSGSLLDTGTSATCLSTTDALDMVGNIMEWAADIDVSVTSGATTADASLAWALGNAYPNNVGGLPQSTKAIFVLTDGPVAVNDQVGFRCVK